MEEFTKDQIKEKKIIDVVNMSGDLIHLETKMGG